MIRLFTSLNWVIGTLAVVAAVIFPTLHESFYMNALRLSVETTVNRIGTVEAAKYQTKESFIYFPSEPGKFEAAMQALGVDIKAGDFEIQAFPTDNDALVIRAITSPQFMRKGYAPPMMYEYKISRPGATGAGEWAMFSKAKPGLGFDFFKSAIDWAIRSW